MAIIQVAQVTIPANGEIPLSLFGDFFYCRSASDSFKVEGITTDNKFVSEAGAKVRLSKSESQYRFINETGTDITATILYGQGDYELDKFVGDVTVINTSPIPVQEEFATVMISEEYMSASTTPKKIAEGQIEHLVIRHSDTARYLYIGWDNTVGSQQIRLDVGQEIELKKYSGEVWIYTNTLTTAYGIFGCKRA